MQMSGACERAGRNGCRARGCQLRDPEKAEVRLPERVVTAQHYLVGSTWPSHGITTYFGYTQATPLAAFVSNGMERQ